MEVVFRWDSYLGKRGIYVKRIRMDTAAIVAFYHAWSRAKLGTCVSLMLDKDSGDEFVFEPHDGDVAITLGTSYMRTPSEPLSSAKWERIASAWRKVDVMDLVRNEYVIDHFVGEGTPFFQAGVYATMVLQ